MKMCVRTLLFYFCDVFFFFIVVLLNETVNFLIFFVGFRGFFMLGYLKEYCKYSDIPNWILTISQFMKQNKRNMNKKRIRKKEKYLYNVYMAYETGGCCGGCSIVVLYYCCRWWCCFFLVCCRWWCCRFVWISFVVLFVL